MRIQKSRADDPYLRAAFSWLTRIGAGRKFGSLPIGWYQNHQMHALSVLEKIEDGDYPVRMKKGMIQRKTKEGLWVDIMSPEKLFRTADDLTRSL